MPPRTTQESHRPRASDRTMVGNAATVTACSVSGAESAHHDCRITQEEEANRSASHREANGNCTSKQGLDAAKTVLAPGSGRSVFPLTSPFIGHSEKETSQGLRKNQCSRAHTFANVAPIKGPHALS